MFKLLSTCTLTEKILIGIFALVILISGAQIGSAYYQQNSKTVPGEGGTFVEGTTGEFNFINPVLAQTGLDRDLTNLVFAGLTKFDPISNNIVDHLATHTLSPDKRTYTFTLEDNLYWHDGEPVTADDVIFTFRDVIQNEAFPNPTLANDFSDVLITKIDDRTVTMTLKNQYAFFIYNTTVGLLPRHLLKDTPVSDLPASNFNLQPVGCGPYKLDVVTGSGIQLSAFENYFKGQPYIDNVVFRIYPSETELFSNISGVTATKNLTDDQVGSLQNDARLKLHEFTLPQYVALFFNTDRPILKDKKLRLGLQLATNKKAVITARGGLVKIIDTPLLEIASSDWKYEFDASKADGALYDSGWLYLDANPIATPAAQPAPAPSASQPAPGTIDPGYITLPSTERYYATSEHEFFLEGSAPEGSSKILVNGYQLSKFKVGDQSWAYKASQKINTLKEGENEYEVKNQNGEIDRITIYYSADETARQNWLAEKQKTLTPPNESIPPPAPEEAVAITQPIVTNDLRVRYKDGQPLILKLLMPTGREDFARVSKELVKQWAERGVQLVIESVPDTEFAKRLNKRDYDILLFGQNLGYNLDTYSFWHSSEAGENGSNLSNLKSSAVNAYLEQVRSSFDSSERRKRLAGLRDALGEEVPAVMLYTPTYSYAIDSRIKDFNLGRIALKRDRFANITDWYLREDRQATDSLGFFNFLSWFWQNL